MRPEISWVMEWKLPEDKTVSDLVYGLEKNRKIKQNFDTAFILGLKQNSGSLGHNVEVKAQKL